MLVIHLSSRLQSQSKMIPSPLPPPRPIPPPRGTIDKRRPGVAPQSPSGASSIGPPLPPQPQVESGSGSGQTEKETQGGANDEDRRGTVLSAISDATDIEDMYITHDTNLGFEEAETGT